LVVKKSRHYIKKSTIANEERLAQKTGSIRQPASGALAMFKGDFRNKTYLFDNKKSFSETITLSLQMFEQIVRDAKQRARIPCLSLTIMNHDFWILPIKHLNIDKNIDLELVTIRKYCKFKIEELRDRDILLAFKVRLIPSIWVLLNDIEFLGDKYVQHHN